jgi:hypothetical protein
VSQGEDVINFSVLKAGIRRSVGELTAVRAMSVLRGVHGAPASVSIGNAELMQCVKGPWEEAFVESRCLKSWNKTGLSPCTRRVYWELRDHEERKQAQSRETEQATGLNLANFLLNGIASQVERDDRAVRREIEEELRDLLDDLDDSARADMVDEVAGRRVGALNSSKLWDIAGGVTGPAASRLVFEDAQARKAKRDEAQARKDAKAADDVMRRQNAAHLLDSVKTIVRNKGWQTGGRGGLTSQMLRDVLFLLNQPAKTGEKVADLVLRAQSLLGWSDHAGFPGEGPPMGHPGLPPADGGSGAAPPAPPHQPVLCPVPAPPVPFEDPQR